MSDAPDDDGNSHPETESDLHCGTVLPVGGLRGHTGPCSSKWHLWRQNLSYFRVSYTKYFKQIKIAEVQKYLVNV